MMKRENKQEDKVNIAFIGLVLAIILSINYISALSVGIGNGKAVLNAKVGDIIEKSVKVINYDNVSVVIELIGGGDLKEQFKFKKNNFTLAPNEETDAGYLLRITKEGRSDSQINVKFTPVEGKNGIILPASIIIFAAKGNSTNTTDNSWTDDWFNKGDDNTTSIEPGDKNKNENKVNPFVIGLFITAVIFVILLILLFLFSKNKKKVKLKQRKSELKL